MCYNSNVLLKKLIGIFMENIVVKNRRILKVLQELSSENVFGRHPKNSTTIKTYMDHKKDSMGRTRSKLGAYSSGPSFR